MLNESDGSNPARRNPDLRVLRVVPVDPRAAGAVRPAGSPSMRRGAPQTAEEWTALVKVGSGEHDIPAAHCERLLTLGLVVTVSGRPALTRHGRFTLGLPD